MNTGKKNYDEISIPAQLDEVITKSMRRAERTKRLRSLRRMAVSAAAVVCVLFASANICLLYTSLYAKTAALIKRSRRQVLTGGRMEAGGIVLEDSTRRVWAGGRELALTPKEYALLRCLMINRGLVMSREQLLVKCWGYDYEGEALSLIHILAAYI